MSSGARIRRVILLGLLCVGLAACGKDNGGNNGNNGDDGNNGASDTGTDTVEADAVDSQDDDTDLTDAADTMDTGPATIPADEIDVALHEKVCEAAWECPNRDVYELTLMFYGRFNSVEECKNTRPLPPIELLQGISDIQAAVELGRISYDAELAATCIDAIYEGFCDIERALLPANCETDVFTGQVPNGDACKFDGECEPGLVCATSVECDGTCTATMEVHCAGVECAEDEYCDVDTCVDRKTAGESCNQTSECQEGLSCDTSTMPARCVENYSRVEGESCGLTKVCEAGTICVSGSCEAFLFVGEGQTCTEMGLPMRFCNPGLVCHDVDASGEGTCKTPLSEGESCEWDYECHADLYCGEPNPGDPTECLPRKAAGSSCSGTIECESFYCDSSTNECGAPDTCY